MDIPTPLRGETQALGKPFASLSDWHREFIAAAVTFVGTALEPHPLRAELGESGVRAYWEERNQRSIDGIATDILSRNT